MGKSIEELFKTKILQDGQTAQVKYDIRNSKDMPITPAISALDLSFKAATEVRRKLSTRIGESRLEQEITGLRVINKLSAPIIYGTALPKLTSQRTDTVVFMKDSVNPEGISSGGLIGGTIQKIQQIGQNALSQLGIKVPTEIIPSKITINTDFKKSSEPDIMITLAKIRNDAKGNFVGQLLKDSVRGTPSQIGNLIVGNLIDAAKAKLRNLLFGNPNSPTPNLAQRGDGSGLYSSFKSYASTINLRSTDVNARYDLSTLYNLVEQSKVVPTNNSHAGIVKLSQPLPPVSANIKTPFGNLKNPFAKIQDTFKTQRDLVTSRLNEGRKAGQQAIANGTSKVGSLNIPGLTIPNIDMGGGISIPAAAPVSNESETITYSGTVDEEQGDIGLRNDLSSVLVNLDAESKRLKFNVGIGIPVDRTQFDKSYSSIKNSQTSPKRTLKTKLGIDSSERMDFLNEKTQYIPTKADGKTISQDGKLYLADGSTLDEYDFVTLKFQSLSSRYAVNFRATITGLNESTTPDWGSAQFIGSPFKYYTYNGVERSVTFNFKVYSTTPMQHVAAWQRLNFLTSLAYPQGYAGGIGARAPFLKFTLGNMYKDRNCYIDSLSYSIDDGTPWHVGFTEASGLADDSKFVINGEQTSLDNYILPKIIDVAITLKLVEQRSNTETEYLYGFDKLPRINLKGADGVTSLYTTEQSSKNSQIAANANNNSLLLGTIASDNTKTENNKQLTTADSQTTTIPASEANRITNFIAGGVNLNNSSTLGLSNNFKFAPNPLAGIPPFKTTLSPFNIDTNKLLGTPTFNTAIGANTPILGNPTFGGLKFNSPLTATTPTFSTANLMNSSLKLTNTNFNTGGKFKLNLKSFK